MDTHRQTKTHTGTCRQSNIKRKALRIALGQTDASNCQIPAACELNLWDGMIWMLRKTIVLLAIYLGWEDKVKFIGWQLWHFVIVTSSRIYDCLSISWFCENFSLWALDEYAIWGGNSAPHRQKWWYRIAKHRQYGVWPVSHFPPTLSYYLCSWPRTQMESLSGWLGGLDRMGSGGRGGGGIASEVGSRRTF